MVSNSNKAWRYFDPHFLLPILDFVADRKLASSAEILQARIKAVSSTFMVDHLQGLYGEAKLSVPVDLEAKKAEVLLEYERKQQPLAPLLEVIEKDGIESLKTMTLADLCLKFNLSADILDTLFEYARLSYQVGDYARASQLLQIYRTLTSSNETTSIPTERQLRALWGCIASFIVQEDYERAVEVIVKLIEFFDNSSLPKDKFSYGASALWLLHWAVLAAFKADQFPTDLIPLLIRDKFLNVVSISAPYLWKYVSAMIILASEEQRATLPLQEISNMIAKDSELADDPLCQIVVDLYQSFDFQAAESRLAGIASSTTNDYFLTTHGDQLRSKAQALIDATKLRIYQ